MPSLPKREHTAATPKVRFGSICQPQRESRRRAWIIPGTLWPWPTGPRRGYPRPSSIATTTTPQEASPCAYRTTLPCSLPSPPISGLNFHSLFRVLFSFPLRYLFAIGLPLPYLALDGTHHPYSVCTIKQTYSLGLGPHCSPPRASHGREKDFHPLWSTSSRLWRRAFQLIYLAAAPRERRGSQTLNFTTRYGSRDPHPI